MKSHSPKSEDGFPESVIHKSSRAMIYRFRNRGGYRYEVRHHDSEERLQRSTFKTYAAAKKHATNLVREMAGGGLDFLSLRGSERRAYERAMGLLHNTGIELDHAVAQFVQARAILKDAATLTEAAEYLVENRPSVTFSKTVRFVVDQLVKAKKADGVSQLYLRDLRTRLDRVASHFQCPIAAMRTPDIEAFLRGLKVGRRYRHNFLTTLGTLFNFAKAQGYLNDEHPGVSKVAKQRKDPTIIGILTPQEFAKVLGAANEELVPALVLGGFGGLRSAECQRMDWSLVKLQERHIEVPGTISKTRTRRIVPISDNMAVWLAVCQQTKGPMVPYQNLAQQFAKTAKRAGITWKRNGLRHSFISYRVALTKNVPQTSMEAGNSVSIIMQHYFRAVTKDQARAWFDILPDAPTNITEVPFQPVEQAQQVH